jgi:glycosyltransferase involved in cell wall biosynthesis
MLNCLIVPHYDHVKQFKILLPGLAAHGLPLIVVDDASPGGSFDALQHLLEGHSGDVTLIRHDLNLGKGAAVITALRAAQAAGHTHALQVDADGQHDVSSIGRFCEASEQYPERIICGEPVFARDVSKLRYYARYITLSFSWLESLSMEIRDAMCGFRMYPVDAMLLILSKSTPGLRMTFDPEILVRAVWDGVGLYFVPVEVRYPESGKSHFRYFRDNIEISWMHTRLITGMLLRLPVLLKRKLSTRHRPATK